MIEWLPLFPLPTTVLFPTVFLPLHIFEPRYRDMVADALAGDRLIGVVLLREGWQKDYEGRPAVYPIGCSGVITHVERLRDGRYNLVLRGLDRFRIAIEDHSKRYRRTTIETLADARITADDRQELRRLRGRLESLMAPTLERAGAESPMTSAMPDEDLVNALAQYLDLDPIEKQALLEADGIVARAIALVELLDMRLLMARSPGSHGIAH